MGPSPRKPSQVHHTQPACLLPDAPGPPSPFTLLETSELCPADSPTALAMTWHLPHLKLTSWQSEPQQPCSLDRPKLYQSPIRNLSFSFWVLLLPASSLPDLRGGSLLSWQMAHWSPQQIEHQQRGGEYLVFTFRSGWECALGSRRPQVSAGNVVFGWLSLLSSPTQLACFVTGRQMWLWASPDLLLRQLEASGAGQAS